MLKELRGYGPAGRPVAPTHPHLAETIRLERMKPFKGRAALAVRRLNPAQPRLPKFIGGDGESRTLMHKALVSKTSVSSSSTTSPLTNSSTYEHTSDMRASDSSPPAAANRFAARITPAANAKKRKPLDFRGALGESLTLPDSAAPLRTQRIAEELGAIRVE